MLDSSPQVLPFIWGCSRRSPETRGGHSQTVLTRPRSWRSLISTIASAWGEASSSKLAPTLGYFTSMTLYPTNTMMMITTFSSGCASRPNRYQRSLNPPRVYCYSPEVLWSHGEPDAAETIQFLEIQ